MPSATEGLEEFGLGARELRRALRGFLEDPIAFSILKHQAHQFEQFCRSRNVLLYPVARWILEDL